MSYRIMFPFLWDEIHAENDSVDVCIETEDGQHYTLVIATPEYLKTRMQRDALPFLYPALPFLFVEKLTKENILRLVDQLMREDPQLLRIYGTDLTDPEAP